MPYRHVRAAAAAAAALSLAALAAPAQAEWVASWTAAPHAPLAASTDLNLALSMTLNVYSSAPSATERRPRRALVALGFVCLALVGGALYFQYARNEDPCPLCILQRYGFLLVALFAPWLAPKDPYAQLLLSEVRQGSIPGAREGFPLGVDQLGRDLLYRLIYGSRQSLLIGVVSTVLGAVVAAVVPALAIARRDPLKVLRAP